MNSNIDSMSLTRYHHAIPVVVLVFVIPLVCLVGPWSTPPLSSPLFVKDFTAQLFLSSLITYWFWLQRTNTQNTITLSLTTLPLTLLFVLGSLSFIWADNFDFYIQKWLKWYCSFIMFFLGLQIVQTQKNLATIFNGLIISGFLISAIGICQYLFNFSVLNQVGISSSTFGNGNMAGHVIVLVVPFTLYFLFDKETGTKSIWAYAITTSILLTYAYYLKSIAVWLAFTTEIILLIALIIFDLRTKVEWLHWNRKKSIASLISLLLFFILTNSTNEGFSLSSNDGVQINYEISKTLKDISATSGRDMNGRYINMLSAIAMIKDYPIIGSGLGSFFEKLNTGNYHHLRMIGAQQVHNDVLELGVELGTTGLILLASMLLGITLVIFKLISQSKDINRRTALLLTMALCGSFLNAQFSFPFQLTTPLLLAPFYIALLLNNNDNRYENSKIIQFNVGAIFYKTGFVISGIILTMTIYLNSFWMSDYNSISRSFGNKSQHTPLTLKSTVMNPELILLLRIASIDSFIARQDELGLNFLAPLIEYWPTSTVHLIQMARHYNQLQNWEETEKWAKLLIKSQPSNAFVGELFLMKTYMANKNLEGVKNIYKKLQAKPDSFLLQQQEYLATLITLSSMLEDFKNTPIYYQKYLKNFKPHVQVETNMAVFEITRKQYGRALVHMRNVLKMNPNVENANSFRFLVNKYSGTSIDPEYKSTKNDEI